MAPSPLKFILDIPELRGVDLDSPEIVALRKDVVRRKRFLSAIYRDWYDRMDATSAESPKGGKVEIGSGPGFLKTRIPGLISSDLVVSGTPDIAFSCEAMPFVPASLSSIFMVNVFHHIQHPASFLREAERCLRPGGCVVMIEPWNTTWSRIVWTRLHHEPFEPGAGWDLASDTPLSSANGALPWIVFERDRTTFDATFPNLRVVEIQPLMPVAYLLSGGVSMRSLAPGFLYRPIRCVESLFDRLGMFALIHLERGG